MYSDRLLPHDPEAEEAVIGSILIDGESLPQVSGVLKSNDFYQAKCRWCFEASLSLFDRGEPINQISIAHELTLLNKLEEAGGAAYLAHLVRSVPTSVHIVLLLEKTLIAF